MPQKLDDLTGKKFGSLQVIKKLPRISNYGSTNYLVCCSTCKAIKRVQRGTLLRISRPNTGCANCNKREPAKKLYLNRSFNGSRVTRLLGSDSDGKLRWEIRCRCNELFQMNTQRLKRGISAERLVCGSCSRSKEDRLYFWENRFAVFTGNARKRKISCEVSFTEFVKLASKSCTYCGTEPQHREQARQDKRSRKVSGFASSIDRLDSSAPYVLQNCVPACDLCNKMKTDDSVDAFLSRMERIAARHW